MPAIRQKLVAGAVMVLDLQLSEGVVTVVCEREEKAEALGGGDERCKSFAFARIARKCTLQRFEISSTLILKHLTYLATSYSK
jgi:hypothetical protein